MFQSKSKSKTNVFRVGTLLASLLSLSSSQLATFAADNVELKSLSPQIDTAPANPTPTPTTDDTTASKIHKLEASKQALKEETSDNSEPALSGEEGQQRGGPLIFMNTFTFRTNVTTSVNNITTSTSTSSGSGTFGAIDPLLMLKAMFGGGSSRGMQKLYAERDTGYGVCGFLMNMPIGKRAYVAVLRSFPSMPAAEADLRPGDLITSVNGKSTLDLPPREVWDWFTGMPGTEVKLEMLRGDQPFNVTLKRMDIGRIPDFSTRAEFLTIYEHNGMSKFVQR